jgi:putative intracellular protease/amidase
MAGLRQFSNIKVVTFALDNGPVRSMGNLSVQPDLPLAQVDPADIGLLILTGGLQWEKGGTAPELSNLVRQILQQDKGLAAICGATLFLAREIFRYFDLLENDRFLVWFRYFLPDPSPQG